MPLRALEGLPLVLPGREHGLRTVIDDAVARVGIALQVAPEDAGYEALRDEFLDRYAARLTRESTVPSGISSRFAAS